MGNLLDRIANYLGNGGLINPEWMEHDKVRDLIMDCRDKIEQLEEQVANYKYDYSSEECTTLEALWFNRGVRYNRPLIDRLKEDRDNMYFKLRDRKEEVLNLKRELAKFRPATTADLNGIVYAKDE